MPNDEVSRGDELRAQGWREEDVRRYEQLWEYRRRWGAINLERIERLFLRKAESELSQHQSRKSTQPISGHLVSHSQSAITPDRSTVSKANDPSATPHRSGMETDCFVALDFETADQGRDSACSIALVRVERQVIVHREHHLIRPPRRNFAFTSTLPPGLYDHPLSEATHQALASQAGSLHHLEPLDPAEAPQRLARYLRQLSETALASLPEAQRQQQQLALVNRIVALLHQQIPSAIHPGDQLHPSARLLQELRATPLLPGEAPITRPLIPLADGTLLINAPSEPSVGLALQTECPSADRIDLLCAFIRWSGLRLLEPVLKPYLGLAEEPRTIAGQLISATFSG
jgi:hypothetical protein